MNRIANESKMPFRCVTQWASYQSGKVHDTLGLPIAPDLVASRLPAGGAGAPASELSESKAPSSRKKVVRGKKSDAK